MYNYFSTPASVTASAITHNLAIGASGSHGGNGGDGLGGGVANELEGTLSISSTTVAYNEAQGGDGRNGGDGLGGGLYNDASSTLTLTGSHSPIQLGHRRRRRQRRQRRPGHRRRGL